LALRLHGHFAQATTFSIGYALALSAASSGISPSSVGFVEESVVGASCVLAALVGNSALNSNLA